MFCRGGVGDMEDAQSRRPTDGACEGVLAAAAADEEDIALLGTGKGLAHARSVARGGGCVDYRAVCERF